MRQLRVFIIVFALIAIAGPAAAQTSAQDYPQWRGQNRDGSASGFVEPKAWPEQLTPLWKVEVGAGYATPIVIGNRVYTHTRQGENELMLALDAATGKVVWQTPYPAPYKMNPATKNHGQGPKSTPLFYKGVIALKPVRQNNQWTVQTVWETPEVAMFMSNPVVVGDTLFGLSHRASGQYFALDLNQGKVLWLGEPRQAVNTAIVKAGETLFLLNEDAQLIVAKSSRTGFDPVKRYEVATSSTWAQPAIAGNRLFIKDVSTLALYRLN